MESCWFVLKQSHYPPPKLPANGTGIGNGAICPGHIIPSLNDLDGVLNRTIEGFNFTQAVPIHSTRAWDLEWDMGRMHQAGLSADASVPIAEVVGITAQAKAAVAFQKTVQNHRFFDKLDRYIILPTRSYIKGVLENADVQEHIQGKWLGAWTIFMITGVTVARGSRGGTSESQKKSAETGVGVNVEGAATGSLNASASSEAEMSLSAGAESDFVWAVRLSKIWKGTFDRTWSFRTQSEGSTFALDEDEDQKREDASEALDAEGKSEAEKIWLGGGEGFIVL